MNDEKKKRPLLQTQGRGREVAETTRRDSDSLSLHELDHGQLKLTAKEYVLKFGTEKDFEAIQKIIIERRKKIPGWSFWKCSNPKCRFIMRAEGDKDLTGQTCIVCNHQNYTDGGRKIRMTKTEIEKMFADEKAASEKWNADAPRRAKELSEFNRRMAQNIPRGEIF